MPDSVTKVEGETTTTTSSPGKAETKQTNAELKETVTTTPEATEVDLEGFDEYPDNPAEKRVGITVGESTYYGKDATEAWKNFQDGAKGKDESYKTTAKKLKELETRNAIREPEETSDEELPPAPDRAELVRATFSKQGLDPRMAGWERRDQRWKDYQTEQGLSDVELLELKNDVQQARDKAQTAVADAEVVWFNRSTLHQELTPKVRELTVEAGLDPEVMGAQYLEVLKLPESVYKNGQLNVSNVLSEFNKRIIRELRKQGSSSTELAQVKAQLQKELDEKRKTLGSPSHTATKTNVTATEPKSIKDAFAQAGKLNLFQSKG